jgi:Tol biopolymer transport system component
VLAFETTIGYSPQLAWFDRSGKMLSTLLMPGPIKSLRLSPDGRRLAADVVDLRTGISDIWIQDVERRVPRRFTYQENDEVNPIWSAEGARVIFRSDSHGPPDIHEKAVEGSGGEAVVFASSGVQHPLDISADNQRLIYLEEDRITRADLWMLPLSGERKPAPLLRTPFEERDAVFSPDGRWIAFESDESGAPEVYVMPINAVGSRRRVSLAGGQTPRWRRDGRELFYMAPNGAVMSVAVTSGAELGLAPARLLFVAERAISDIYDVSPDGERFLVNTVVERDTAPITVILNWTTMLRQ